MLVPGVERDSFVKESYLRLLVAFEMLITAEGLVAARVVTLAHGSAHDID